LPRHGNLQPIINKQVKFKKNSFYNELKLISTKIIFFSFTYIVRFDYSDAFVNNHNIDFLTRVSQMQRLQMETVDWERKRKLSKKKLPTGTTNETNKKD